MYPFFTLFAILGLFTFVYMRRSANDFSKKNEEFMEREREANSVRKQPLTDLKYIEYDYSPFESINTDDEYILERLKTLKVLSEEENKIVNLSNFTNTDLKLKYGVANLTILSEYDQNFTNLCRCLYELGKRFYENGDITNAKSFLELGVKCGTDLKSHYSLLADIYEQNLQYKDIVTLSHIAENAVNATLRPALIKEFKNKLEGTNYSINDEQKPLEDISSDN